MRFIARILGAPETVPAGRSGLERIHGCQLGPKADHGPTGQMHDIAEILYFHVLRDLHALSSGDFIYRPLNQLTYGAQPLPSRQQQLCQGFIFSHPSRAVWSQPIGLVRNLPLLDPEPDFLGWLR